MNDLDIISIWDEMGGYNQFCKEFGYLQFARRLLEVANIQATEDGRRYRALRDPGCPEDGTVFACVYVHAPGTIPYQKAVVGAELDAVTNAALAQKEA